MSGTITKRGRASWQIRFDAGSINGKRQRRHVTVRGTWRSQGAGGANGGNLRRVVLFRWPDRTRRRPCNEHEDRQGLPEHL